MNEEKNFPNNLIKGSDFMNENKTNINCLTTVFPIPHKNSVK